MPKFKLICEHEYAGSINTSEFSAETLDDTLLQMLFFLRGCSYVIHEFAELKIVEPEETNQWDVISSVKEADVRKMRKARRNK